MFDLMKWISSIMKEQCKEIDKKRRQERFGNPLEASHDQYLCNHAFSFYAPEGERLLMDSQGGQKYVKNTP
jgi:hypothetical protein